MPTDEFLLARPDPGTAVGGVLVFGDSRVAHWSPLPQRPYPITRHGHSGESAIRLVPSFTAALERHRPQLVLLQLGINDALAAAVVSPSARAAAEGDTEAAIAAMAEAAQVRGVKLVILHVIPPIRPDPLRRLVSRGVSEEYVERLNRELPGIAARHGATAIDPLPLLGPAAAEVPDAYRADSVHLTAAAYGRLNRLFPDRLSNQPAS